METRVSVAIPTHNRAEILRKVLNAYAAQSGDHQIREILVVDDGSTDHTASVVQHSRATCPFPIRYLYQQNRGLASARNHAIREAQGDLILFVDDDIIPRMDVVAQHVAWHRKYPQPEVGVLGLVTWAPELHPNGFMKWEGRYGAHFSFGLLRPGAEVGFRDALFGFTSLKKQFLATQSGFSESFRHYGPEDVEFGYRFIKAGGRILYNPDAVGLHYKYETLQDALRRIQRWYESWEEYLQTEAGAKHAELGGYETDVFMFPKKPLHRRLLRPLKGPFVRLARPLVNTRIPLPRFVYHTVYYHYASPMFEAAFRKAVRRRDEARQLRPA